MAAQGKSVKRAILIILLMLALPAGAAAQSAPDLILLGPNVSKSSPEAGDTFWFIATVTNQGDERSEATTVRYYRSTDATITASDTEEGTDAVGAKGHHQGYAATIRLTAPSTAGTYYYGACVDAVPGESDTTNNCSKCRVGHCVGWRRRRRRRRWRRWRWIRGPFSVGLRSPPP